MLRHIPAGVCHLRSLSPSTWPLPTLFSVFILPSLLALSSESNSRPQLSPWLTIGKEAVVLQLYALCWWVFTANRTAILETPHPPLPCARSPALAATSAPTASLSHTEDEPRRRMDEHRQEVNSKRLSGASFSCLSKRGHPCHATTFAPLANRISWIILKLILGRMRREWSNCDTNLYRRKTTASTNKLRQVVIHSLNHQQKSKTFLWSPSTLSLHWYV